MRTRNSDNGLKRIAQQLQLSVSTVSRALNGVYGVNPETRDKVREAAKALGYVPNMGAKQLVGKGSALIAVFAPRFEQEASQSFLHLFGWLQLALSGVGKDVILFSVPFHGCPPGKLAESLGARGIEGCILLPGIVEAHPVMQEALRMQVPCVNFEGVVGPRCASAVSDDREGGRMAGRHLLALGHRRIAYINGPPHARVSVERMAGLADAFAEAGLPTGGFEVFPGDFSGMSGAAAVRTLIRGSPDVTGVYCANDLMALGAIMALTEMEVRVPQRMSVVGHDGEFFTAYGNPPLTTVAHDYERMASRAAEMMMDLLAGAAGTMERIPPLLMARATTARIGDTVYEGMEDSR